MELNLLMPSEVPNCLCSHWELLSLCGGGTCLPWVTEEALQEQMAVTWASDRGPQPALNLILCIMLAGPASYPLVPSFLICMVMDPKSSGKTQSLALGHSSLG